MTLKDIFDYQGNPKAVYLQFHNLPAFERSADVFNLPVILYEEVDLFNIEGVFIGSTSYLQDKYRFWKDQPNQIEMFCQDLGW